MRREIREPAKRNADTCLPTIPINCLTTRLFDTEEQLSGTKRVDTTRLAFKKAERVRQAHHRTPTVVFPLEYGLSEYSR